MGYAGKISLRKNHEKKKAPKEGAFLHLKEADLSLSFAFFRQIRYNGERIGEEGVL